MKQITLLLIMAFVVTAGYSADKNKPAKKSPEVTVTGYLVDVHCAKNLMKKNDVAIPAKQHERSCDLMPECAASGYGVFVVVNKSATHASDVDWYPLDAKGNKMAKEILEKSTKKDDILVTVNGKSTINVESMTEVK